MKKKIPGALDIDDEFAHSIENFVTVDACALPFDDNTFGLVMSHANNSFDFDEDG